MVGELGHIEQVVGDAAHDGADLGVVVVGVVELEQVVEGVPAHIRLDVDAHDVADARHEVLRRAVDDPEHKVDRRQLEHDGRRQGNADAHGRVGDGAHDLGQDDVAKSRQCGAEQIKEQRGLVLGQIRQEPPDQCAAAGVVCRRVLDGFLHGFSFFTGLPSQSRFARQIPPSVANATSPSGRRESFLKGGALGKTRKLSRTAKASHFGRGGTAQAVTERVRTLTLRLSYKTAKPPQGKTLLRRCRRQLCRFWNSVVKV